MSIILKICLNQFCNSKKLTGYDYLPCDEHCFFAYEKKIATKKKVLNVRYYDFNCREQLETLNFLMETFVELKLEIIKFIANNLLE